MTILYEYDYPVKVRWILTIFACGACAQTLELPRTIRQGDTLRIHAPVSTLKAKMNDRTIRLFPQTGGESFGLIPVPVDQKPGDYRIEVFDRGGAAVATASVKVVDAHFPKQNVVIGQSLAELKPSPGETETVTAFRNAVSEVRYWAEPLALPVRGCMNVALRRATVYERQADREFSRRDRSEVTSGHAGPCSK
jgi:hypothetical protein